MCSTLTILYVFGSNSSNLCSVVCLSVGEVSGLNMSISLKQQKRSALQEKIAQKQTLGDQHQRAKRLAQSIPRRCVPKMGWSAVSRSRHVSPVAIHVAETNRQALDHGTRAAIVFVEVNQQATELR